MDEHVGIRHFGKAYWDTDKSAHQAFGVHVERGALIVLRPDGLLSFVAPLSEFGRVALYLDLLVVAVEQDVVRKANGHATRRELGDFITSDENNLVMPVDDGGHKEAGLVRA